jgi:pimeloyl-ACP methyl ester carboxylesterase
MSITHLQHNRVTLALHKVRDGKGRPLLLLHGLGEDATRVAQIPLQWAGPVYALDFTGHGESSIPQGGGYNAEILMADVDIALRHIGEPVTIVGRGLGGYVGFLISCGRASLVRGLIIIDGPGLAGGASNTISTTEIASIGKRSGRTPDPWALIELSRDLRPASYANSFLRLAVANSGIDDPIAVATKVEPLWIEAIKPEAGVITDISMQEALDIYAAL